MSIITTLYVIRDKETKDIMCFNGRGAWLSVSAAKSSYAASYYPRLKWKDQTQYEIINILDNKKN